MKTLVILTGPTGVGKTELSLRLAEELSSPILSCDSRQLYREIPIGTAAPDSTQLARVPHEFIGTHSIHENYSAAKYELDVLKRLDVHFAHREYVLMTGGSMLYIDAVCKGIDDMPDVEPAIRSELQHQFASGRFEEQLHLLKKLDPAYYEEVDRQNPKRVIHGLEICIQTGKPFSSFRNKTPKKRPFRICKIALNRDRTELYQRIDLRVAQMLEDGLEAEAKAVYPYRHLNALNTVGFKEMFAYFDGALSLDEAVQRIQFNSHKYARKQLTWFRKDPEYHWFHPSDFDAVYSYLRGLNDLI